MARVKAASGDSSEALANLKTIVEETRRRGLGRLEFYARLAQGKTQIAPGNKTEGEKQLAVLERDALEKGFNRIAKRTTLSLKPK